MKTCLQEEILQAYLDGELPQEAGDSVAAHLAECTVCAARVGEAQQTWMAIDGALASELPEVIPTARLRVRIESALAEKAAPKFTLASLWNWKLAAVTAAILLALSALLFRPANQPPHHEQAVLPAPVSTPDFIPSPTPPPVRDVAQQPLPIRKRVLRRTPTSNAEEAEVVTRFFSLRDGEDLTTIESGQLVRVELPGSALSEAGYPFNPETAQTSVIADVVLGQDGLARAIRFVR